MKKDILYIYGFDGCPFFYNACLYAAILKKENKCKDYEIISYERNKFLEFLDSNTESKNHGHKTCPFVIHDNVYVGGCDSLYKYFELKK